MAWSLIVCLDLNIVLIPNLLPVPLNSFMYLVHIALLQFLWVSLLVSDNYWVLTCFFLLVCYLGSHCFLMLSLFVDVHFLDLLYCSRSLQRDFCVFEF